jgi:hypothetical protein
MTSVFAWFATDGLHATIGVVAVLVVGFLAGCVGQVVTDWTLGVLAIRRFDHRHPGVRSGSSALVPTRQQAASERVDQLDESTATLPRAYSAEPIDGGRS